MSGDVAEPAAEDARLRVVVGEDQALVREGLVLLLERGGFEVVAAAADGDDLVRRTRAHRPDLVIADVRMPPTQTDEGLRAAMAIRAELPPVGIVVLSQHLHRQSTRELLEVAAEGGVGYLLKQRVSDGEAFCAALRQVAAGRTVLDPEVAALVISSSPRRKLDRLTPRQREVLELIAEGRSNAAIARRLFLSEKAVGKHITNIYEALELAPVPDDHRRVLAVLELMEAG